MDPAIISALSAVLGSLVGGSTTFATAWINQRHQGRRALLMAQIESRQALYGEFIDECSKLSIDAVDHSLDDPHILFGAYALLSKIRLASSDAVVLAGEGTIKNIVRQYHLPNVSIGVLPESASASGVAAQVPEGPLKPFSVACRHELSALLHAA